jgi:hypothetical protein
MLNLLNSVIPSNKHKVSCILFPAGDPNYSIELANAGLDLYFMANQIPNHFRIHQFGNQNIPFEYVICTDVTMFEDVRSIKMQTNIPCVLIQNRPLTEERPENLYIIKKSGVFNYSFLAEENNKFFPNAFKTTDPNLVYDILRKREIVPVK